MSAVAYGVAMTSGEPSSHAVGEAPALATLRAQVDHFWPDRSRISDGGMPSEAHHIANPNSDHERGDAYDFTLDCTNGPNLDMLAQVLFQDSRTEYVIWNRRIAHRNFSRGAWRAYSGPNGHTRHLHISIDPKQRDDANEWPNGQATGWDAQGGIA